MVLHETSDPHHDDAIRFIRPYQNERFDVVLPTLWRYEIGQCTRPQSIRDRQGEHVPLDHAYCMVVLDFMREINNITFDDAAYHVLALRTGGTLLTADRRYVKKASGKRQVTLLSDWSV